MEMALVVLGFLTLLLGGMDIARYIFTVQSMDYVAGEAVRAAMIGTLSPQSATLVSATPLPFTTPPFLDPATQLSVTPSIDANNGATIVTVTVTAPFTVVTPGLGALTSSNLTVTTQLEY
jgi:Flp pilus assembly protein TadG